MCVCSRDRALGQLKDGLCGPMRCIHQVCGPLNTIPFLAPSRFEVGVARGRGMVLGWDEGGKMQTPQPARLCTLMDARGMNEFAQALGHLVGGWLGLAPSPAVLQEGWFCPRCSVFCSQPLSLLEAPLNPPPASSQQQRLSALPGLAGLSSRFRGSRRPTQHPRGSPPVPRCVPTLHIPVSQGPPSAQLPSHHVLLCGPRPGHFQGSQHLSCAWMSGRS